MRRTITSFLVLAGLVAAQQQVWGQCGGIGWTGPTTCVSGTYCAVLNPYYSQCLPGSAPGQSTTTTSAPTTITTSTTTSAPPATTSGTSGPTTCPNVPSGLGSGSNKLPDPFTFHSGSKVTSKADWECRQKEIRSLMTQYELGTLPSTTPSVSASYSGNSLSISVSDGGKSISFSVSISKPSGSGPFPAIINFGTFGASIPIPSSTVATIGFNNDEMAAQSGSSSRGQGKFYNLYGSAHPAGAMAAWAWGVSRIVDALELTAAQTGINPKRIGVTGCSRNGKGAFVAGALEPRIALTLPQESGSGGAGCWRLANWQNSNGGGVQPPTQIVTENPWFGKAFDQYVSNVNALPFDHHMLAGLVAPRPMYIMENPDYAWLGTMSTYGCMGAGKKIYDALGATQKFGYSQVGGHSHCSFPGSQSSELNAFINTYLVGSGSGNTGVYRTDQSYPQLNLNEWCPWTVPTLS